MSQASKEDSQPIANESSPGQRGQTVQMNPAMLGQAVNMNPASDVVKQLDVASQMLEEAAQENDQDAGTTDLSIEEYMAALIARSHSPGQELDDSFVVAPPSLSTINDPKDAALTKKDAQHTSEADDAEPAEQRRQAAPAECRVAISELRELANINARCSFNVHQGRQLVYEMHNKLAVTLVALVVSYALTSLSSHARTLPFFAAIVALVIAVSWTAKYFHLARQLRRLCFNKENGD